MPYLGNEVAEKFVSKPAVDHFSGDGSTTVFTLSFPVASDQDILVSVDGVIQDTAAYAVSNSTTLTFTAAPSSNSGNNIFVNYLARVSTTVAHPATSALTATTGTFSGAVSVTGNVSTTPGSVSIKAINGGYTGGLLIEDDSNTTQSAITHVVGTMAISANASADHMLITADGEVTMPAQPSFLAQPASSQDNVGITDGTSVTIALGTERYDVGGNFASNTFTAPVTGKYLLSATVYILNIDSAATYIQFVLTTSNRSYFQLIDPDFGQDAVYWSFNHAQLCDMDANDTAVIKYAQYGGTIQADIQVETNFSGILVG